MLHLLERSFRPLPLLLLLSSGLPGRTPPAGPEAPAAVGERVVLNPFEVGTRRDRGYFSFETTAGTRSGLPLPDIPGSVSILNARLLDDLNVTDPDQALRYGTSGVTSNEHTRDDLSIRGFRQSMPFRDGVQSTAFSVAQLYDIDRIEVVKGPAAMVFGNSGVLGGTINLVARRPTATPQRELTLTVDPAGGYARSTLHVAGPLSTRHRHVRYRLTVGAQEDDLTKPVEHNDQRFLGGAFDFDLGRTTLSLYAFRSEQDRYIIFNDFLDTTVSGTMRFNRYSPRDFAPADPSQDLFFDTRETYLTATFVAPLTDRFSFKAFYRYRKEYEPRRIIRGITVQADNVTLNRQLLNFLFSETGRTGQADFNYRTKVGPTDHTLAFGLDSSAQHTRERLGIFPLAPLNTARPDFRSDAALPFERPPNNQDNRIPGENLSYYIQDFVRFPGARLNLVAGLRWIDPRTTLYNDLNRTTTVTDPGRERVHRYGLVFRPLESVSLYVADVSTFLVNPGVDHLSRPLLNSAGKNREVGAKVWDLSLGPATLFASGAYFDMVQTNIRTTGGVVVVNGVAVTEVLQNAADVSRGFELDVGGRFTAGPGECEAIVTYYLANSRSTTGARSLRTPREVTSFLVKYAFARGPLRNLAAGFGGYFEGDKWATADGRLRHDFSDLYDAFVSYRYDARWMFRLNVENLTDARFVHSYLSPGLVGGNEPRAVRFTVRHSW